jgi:glutaredoxin
MIMNDKRQIEVFIAGCPVCDDAISLVNRIACPSCEVTTLDMRTSEVADRAKALGVRSIPAVVIDGKVADCCQKGVNEEILKTAGLGQPASNN